MINTRPLEKLDKTKTYQVGLYHEGQFIHNTKLVFDKGFEQWLVYERSIPYHGHLPFGSKIKDVEVIIDNEVICRTQVSAEQSFSDNDIDICSHERLVDDKYNFDCTYRWQASRYVTTLLNKIVINDKQNLAEGVTDIYIGDKHYKLQ